jgi:hypothetical protein
MAFALLININYIRNTKKFGQHLKSAHSQCGFILRQLADLENLEILQAQ